MVSDPLGDALIQIKNGYLAGKIDVTFSYSKVKEELIKVLMETKYISSYKLSGDKIAKKIIATLRYENNKPVMTNVVRVSKPSLRVYVGKDKIPNVLSGLGTTIISTPKGLLTTKDARKSKIGGEIICKIW